MFYTDKSAQVPAIYDREVPNARRSRMIKSPPRTHTNKTSLEETGICIPTVSLIAIFLRKPDHYKDPF